MLLQTLMTANNVPMCRVIQYLPSGSHIFPFGIGFHKAYHLASALRYAIVYGEMLMAFHGMDPDEITIEGDLKSKRIMDRTLPPVAVLLGRP